MSSAPVSPHVTFRPLAFDDLPLLQTWLKRPHVAAWWDGVPTLAELEEDYGPTIEGSIPHHCYIALTADEPIGFIQSYSPGAFHADGWWLDEHDPDVRGIDQFLAHEHQLNQGLGTAMVRAFVDFLFREPRVWRIQTDPSPTNHRAIRCYEKAGFRRVREIVTLDGPALLMYCDRGARDATAHSMHDSQA